MLNFYLLELYRIESLFHLCFDVISSVLNVLRKKDDDDEEDDDSDNDDDDKCNFILNKCLNKFKKSFSNYHAKLKQKR